MDVTGKGTKRFNFHLKEKKNQRANKLSQQICFTIFCKIALNVPEVQVLSLHQVFCILHGAVAEKHSFVNVTSVLK